MIRLERAKYGNIAQAIAVETTTKAKAAPYGTQSVCRRQGRGGIGRDSSRSPLIT